MLSGIYSCASCIILCGDYLSIVLKTRKESFKIARQIMNQQKKYAVFLEKEEETKQAWQYLDKIWSKNKKTALKAPSLLNPFHRLDPTSPARHNSALLSTVFK